MELKINCNAFIKLKNFLGISEIKHQVEKFDYRNETLEGRLNIEGEYLNSTNVKDQIQSFKDEVPFVVVFKDDNNEIDAIDCENFEYYEVAGRGIETNFDIVVYYHIKNVDLDELIEIVADEMAKEEQEDIEELINRKTDELAEMEEEVEESNEENIEGLEDFGYESERELKEKKENMEQVDEVKEEEDIDLEIIKDEDLEPLVDMDIEEVEPEEEYAVENEKIKTTITSKIDDLLSEKLETKTDNLPTEAPVLRSISSKKIFSKIPEEKSMIYICYYQDEKDLESICSKYDLSIEKTLKKNEISKRVIIGLD